MKLFNHNAPFPTESGEILSQLQIAYHTYGTMNEDGSNVIWICHAFTANSDAIDWWADMVGVGKCFDPEHQFIVCANYIGSCYGSTGPMSLDIQTNKSYFLSFPEITVRDMVNAHELLRNHLGITKIKTIIGGSIGGFQAMEWAIMNPELIENLVLIACSSKATPWVIALNESQRLSIQADQTFALEQVHGGDNGLIAARSIALTTYRNGYAYNLTQKDEDLNKIRDFKASSYQKYQGEKLVKRFDAYSYFYLTKSIDSHNVGRNRGGVESALELIKAKTLVIGISSDRLFPIEEQQYLAKNIQGAEFYEIHSLFGHDGFLIEFEVLTNIIRDFIEKK
ncbi:MAG: homoserine O-acetyltransferase [Bacteroidota bacterium]